MTAEEFRKAHERIGCTGTKLAEWMGKAPLTITRYRTGALPVPKIVEGFMQALLTGWRP